MNKNIKDIWNVYISNQKLQAIKISVFRDAIKTLKEINGIE